MAVYTALDQASIEMIAARYEWSRISHVQPIAEGVENSNFLLHIDHGGMPLSVILTIFERRVSKVDVPFFLQLQTYLHKQGYPCPTPYLTIQGDMFCTIQGKMAACLTFLQGRSVDVAALMPSHAYQAGTALAQLHHGTQHFPMTRPNTLSLPGWHELRHHIASGDTASLPDHWLRTVDQTLTYVTQHWPLSLPSGIIHADYFPNNVFFDSDGQLCGVIDFYFAAHDYLAFDLAICLNAWCMASGQRNDALYQACLEGYQSQRPLTQAEQEALPVLLQAAALRFLLTRIQDRLRPQDDALVALHDPQEYVDIIAFYRD